jgi:hypothetical protein
LSGVPGYAAPFSILVNTSDGFEDCWNPFFTLFSLHWPNCTVPIFLNTETKDWSFPELSIHATRVQAKQDVARKLSWSECLLGALEQITTPLVLYLQEDYFLSGPTDVARIEEYASLMLRCPEIKHVGLTYFGAAGPFGPTKWPSLWRISDKSRYRVSTQAGLWRVDTLRSYLRAEENGWMFEIFGTWRARRRKELFLTVRRNEAARAPIDYAHTGIVKGRWHPDVPALFARFGIALDFDKRGFYRPLPWPLGKVGTVRKLISEPKALVKNLLGD